MQAIIKCNACESTLGSIEKDNISDEDIAMYRLTVRCECQPLEESIELEQEAE